MQTAKKSEEKCDFSISKCQKTSIYHVQSQDTLCRIAVNHYTTTSNLMKLNKLTTTLIFPGQVLLVPQSTDEDVDCNDTSSIDLPYPIADTIEDAYKFLSPSSALTYSAMENSSVQCLPKPFKNLSVVSCETMENKNVRELKKKVKKKSQYKPRESESIAVDSEKLVECNSFHVHPDMVKKSQTGEESKQNSVDILSRSKSRSISIESCASEPFEENLLKLNVHYLTAVLEHVHGILLVTPTSIMFDPDPTCPLAQEHGCEKFGVVVDLKDVTTLTMYNDTGCLRENDAEIFDTTAEDGDLPSDIAHEIVEISPTASDDLALINDFVSVHISETVDKDGMKKVELHDSDAVTEQTPLLKSLDYISKTDLSLSNGKDEADPSTSRLDELDFMYFCVRANQPIMKTFSVLSALNDATDDVVPKEEVREAWFHVPRRNSDQMMAFFMQWSPDPYALDFAEQNGFVLAETLEVKKKVKSEKSKPRKEVKRSQSTSSSSYSSVCSSLEQSVEEYVGNRKIEREWELVGLEEAKRRSEINANELANADASLIPELRHSSCLINDHTLLELCKRMPARCIGCPWRLLYSTLEHGMSLRTLYRKTKECCDDEDYPAFILIRDSNGHVFGAFTSSRPRISEHFYGSGESFLFTLEPEIEFFDWSGDNSFFIMGTSEALVFGGGDGSAGLWIDEDLRQGRSQTCLTYNNRVLSSSEDFLIQDIEVWGFDEC